MANTMGADTEKIREHRENRKKNLGRKVNPNQAMAVSKFQRVPPRKARLVMDAIRGRYVNDALAFLRFIPNRAAVYISKVLASAAANAVNNHGLNPDNLRLIEARVDEGPRLKRVQPRAQGRAYAILKRTSHITVIVQEVAPRPRKPKAPTGRRAEAARAARRVTTVTTPAETAEEAAEILTSDTPVVHAEETNAEARSTGIGTAEMTMPDTGENVTESNATEVGATTGTETAQEAAAVIESDAPVTHAEETNAEARSTGAGTAEQTMPDTGEAATNDEGASNA